MKGYVEKAGSLLRLSALGAALVWMVFGVMGFVSYSEARSPETRPERGALWAQARPERFPAVNADSPEQRLRNRRAELEKKRDDLLAQQAQLEQRVGQVQKELELPNLPKEYAEKRCKLLDLLSQQKQLRQQIQNVGNQISQAQQGISQSQSQSRAQPPPPSPPSTPSPASAPTRDKLDQLIAQPVNPLRTMPSELRVRLIGEDVDKLSGSASFDFDQGSRTFYMHSSGAGSSMTIKVIFSMSDGSRQEVRLRSFVESASGGSAPGLTVNLGPTMMNKGTRADSLTMWGPIALSWPAGVSGTGRAILDVPLDDKILPEEVRFVFD
ncbi:MAG: hypothetical protein V2B18_20935 [Pseudomonadota bacterium]